MASRKLEDLNVDEVVAWLSSIALDKVLGTEFKEQQIDGELLVDAGPADFPQEDFVKARRLHWNKFWRKLKKAKEEGVVLTPAPDAAAAAPTISSPASPVVPMTTATVISPSSPVAGNVPVASATPIIVASPVAATAVVASPVTATASPVTATAAPVTVTPPPVPPAAPVLAPTPSKTGRTVCRLTDTASGGLANFSPIFGIDQTPITTLDLAVASMQKHPKYAEKFKHLATSSFAAKMFADNFLAEHKASGKHKSLTKEEIASINFFTHETPFYGELNASLRSTNRSDVKTFFPWMKLMLNGLYKLPLGDPKASPGSLTSVFRGVHENLKKFYPTGKKFVNWAFSSCTSSLEVLQSEQFLGNKGDRTLFTIRARSIVDIRDFSSVQDEDELLLLPATMMIVKGCLDAGNGLTMIQLEEDIDGAPLLDFVHPGLTDKKSIDLAKKQRAEAAAKLAEKQRQEESRRQAELQQKISAQKRFQRNGVWKSTPQHKGRYIVISGNTVTKTAQSWNSGTAVVSDGVTLQHGSFFKKRWSFTIKNGTRQTIGLVTSAYNAARDEYANKTRKGWGFYQANGNKGHGGPANTTYASRFNAGDTVDVQVCSATREIRFFVNGADRGVAYSNLPVGTPLYAAVSLYQKDAQTVYNGLVGTSPWLTSTQYKGNDIVISGNTVTKTNPSWGTGTAVVSDGVTLQHGSTVKKRWSFTIKKGTQQTIGLVTSAYNANTDEYVNKTRKGWGIYQANGNKGHGGPATTPYTSKLNAGDTVDVQVCSATREIRFFVNGADRGVAYSNLPVGTPLYAAVSLYQKDAQTVCNVLGSD